VEKEALEHLKSLHTSEIDARNGYEEALADAEGKGFSSLFIDMVGLHENNAQEIGDLLTRLGEPANPDGSFMSAVHRAIVDVRSLFGGLGEGILPGLIDGERRNVEKYDEALKSPALPVAVEQMLTAQRGKIQAGIADMEAGRAASLQN
jgi:uncharacterized protein (TIGR02284 family)